MLESGKPPCGEAVGAELTQTRQMVVDLAAVVLLLDCHAAEEGHQAVHASVRSGWDSLLLMIVKGGRCWRRRTLRPFAHAARRDSGHSVNEDDASKGDGGGRNQVEER